MHSHEVLIRKKTGSPSDTVIIAFSGYNDENRGPQRPFDFHNFLDTHFPHTDKMFFKDDKRHMYHHGPVGDCVETMVDFIREEIIGYKTVVLVGVSSGGYAAILYGSLLDASHIRVLAFIPQTVLSAKSMTEQNLDSRYADLLPHLSRSTTYHVYGDTLRTQQTHVHSFHHCERISILPNIELIRNRGIYLKRLRDTGELLQMFQKILGQQTMNGKEGMNS